MSARLAEVDARSTATADDVWNDLTLDLDRAKGLADALHLVNTCGIPNAQRREHMSYSLDEALARMLISVEEHCQQLADFIPSLKGEP